MGCTASDARGHASLHSSGSGFRSPSCLPRKSLGEVLGEGAYGAVHEVTSTRGLSASSPLVRKPLAAKVIKFHSGAQSEEVPKHRYEKALREADVWERVCSTHSEFVVSLLETFLDEQSVVFVMERCDTTLEQHMVNSPRLDEAIVADLLSQMLHSLQHIHSCDVIHRDVKPDNFLVDKNDTLKISDFGLAVTSENIWAKGDEPHSTHNPSPAPSVAGTAPFMSPEMLSQVVYSTQTDVWSLGCLAFVMLMGQFPYMPKGFLSKSVMKAAIREGRPKPSFQPGPDSMFPSAPKGSYRGPSNNAVAFLASTLCRDAAARPTACEALEHPYLSRRLSVEDSGQLPCLRNMFKRASRCGAF